MADKKQKSIARNRLPPPVSFGFSISHQDSAAPALQEHLSRSKSIVHLKAPLELYREAGHLLLNRHAPPSVVINDQLEIIQSRGHTADFLELPSGKTTLNLLKVACPGLLFDLQNAIDESRKSGLESERNNVRSEKDGTTRAVASRVIPFRTPIQEQQSFLIVFESTFTDQEQLIACESLKTRNRGELSDRLQTNRSIDVGVDGDEGISAIDH